MTGRERRPTITIHVEIPGEPVAQGRPRAFRTGKGQIRTYDPAKSRSWKAEAREAFALARQREGLETLLEGPVACWIQARFTCPQSHFRKREPLPRRWHHQRPDAENVAKAVLDALSGTLVFDDRQIAQLTVNKIFGAQREPPGVGVTIHTLSLPPPAPPADP